MAEEPITDKSLVRCWMKKTASVSEKFIKYGSYLVVGLAASVIAFYGLIGVYEVIAPVVRAIIDGIWQVINQVIALFLGLAWYYQIVAVGVVVVIPAIVTYSFLWCIARELTEDDWENENLSIVIWLVALIISLGTGLILSVVNPENMTMKTASLLLCVIGVGTFFAPMLPVIDKPAQAVLEFPGAAWHHYRKKEKK